MDEMVRRVGYIWPGAICSWTFDLRRSSDNAHKWVVLTIDLDKWGESARLLVASEAGEREPRSLRPRESVSLDFWDRALEVEVGLAHEEGEETNLFLGVATRYSGGPLPAGCVGNGESWVFSYKSIESNGCIVHPPISRPAETGGDGGSEDQPGDVQRAQDYNLHTFGG